MNTHHEQAELHLPHLNAVFGIEGVRVSVDQPAADGAGLSHHDLTHFVHGMLRLAGVPVLSEHDDNSDSPVLHTTVSTHKVLDLFSVTLSVELLDRVWLTRRASTGQALHAATWRRSTQFVSNRHELRHNMRMELGNLLTTFLNDYSAANENRASA
jgi:hypothetical protein